MTMGLELPSSTSPNTQAQSLIQKKTRIEEELQAQITILKAENVDMQTPLVDSEGFPRADVDVYAVRKARVKIIELRNDLKSVIDEIGKALEDIYAKPVESAGPSTSGNDKEEEEEEEVIPFARVDAVAPSSPAAQSGLMKDDLIFKFGHLTKSKFIHPSSLTPLANLVSQSENKHIIVRVLRNDEKIYLTLTPRQGWGGRGMLGCHLVPYTGSLR